MPTRFSLHTVTASFDDEDHEEDEDGSENLEVLRGAFQELNGERREDASHAGEQEAKEILAAIV